MKAGEKIKYLREHRFGTPITQDELCDALNLISQEYVSETGKLPFTLSKHSLSRYEQGKINVSSIELIQALCVYFDISPSYFIVTKTPFIEELFELEIESLEERKIKLRKITDHRIKSLIEYKDELICEFFAVQIPCASDEIFNSNLDYLLLSHVALQPGLVDSFYIKVEIIKKEKTSIKKSDIYIDLKNGSYLVYFTESKRLGIYEKLSDKSNFFIFENKKWRNIYDVKHTDFYLVGFIITENDILQHLKYYDEMNEEIQI